MGYEVLLMGPLGILFLQFAWFANPLFLVSIVFVGLGWRIATAIVAAIAVIIALDMLTLPGTLIYLDEGGVNTTTALGFSAGAWVWLAAMVAPLISIPRPSPPPSETK